MTDSIGDLTRMDMVLKEIETSSTTRRVKMLKYLAKLLCENPSFNETFFQLKGVSRILEYFWSKDRQTINYTLCVLAYSARNHVGNQIALTNENVFWIIYNLLRRSENHTLKSSSRAMFLICHIVQANPRGQNMVRQSKCLKCLVQIFPSLCQLLLNSSMNELEYVMSCWDTLCMSITMSVANPLNSENQAEVQPIISEAVCFLSNWIKNVSLQFHVSRAVDSLISMLPHILMNNSSNQFHFAASSGIHTIVRGLFLLEQWQNPACDLTLILYKFIQLLNIAMIDNVESCKLIGSMHTIPLLLRLLLKFNNTLKLSTLAALTNLIENCKDNRLEFTKENGFSIVHQATNDFKEDSEVRTLVRYICNSSMQCTGCSVTCSPCENENIQQSRVTINSDQFDSGVQTMTSQIEIPRNLMSDSNDTGIKQSHNSEQRMDGLNSTDSCEKQRWQDKVADTNDGLRRLIQVFSNIIPQGNSKQHSTETNTVQPNNNVSENSSIVGIGSYSKHEQKCRLKERRSEIIFKSPLTENICSPNSKRGEYLNFAVPLLPPRKSGETYALYLSSGHNEKAIQQIRRTSPIKKLPVNHLTKVLKSPAGEVQYNDWSKMRAKHSLHIQPPVSSNWKNKEKDLLSSNDEISTSALQDFQIKCKSHSGENETRRNPFETLRRELLPNHCKNSKQWVPTPLHSVSNEMKLLQGHSSNDFRPLEYEVLSEYYENRKRSSTTSRHSKRKRELVKSDEIRAGYANNVKFLGSEMSIPPLSSPQVSQETVSFSDVESSDEQNIGVIPHKKHSCKVKFKDNSNVCRDIRVHKQLSQLESESDGDAESNSTNSKRKWPVEVVRYSEDELRNLAAGVKKYGYNFKLIRRAFTFHEKRTPKDLYLKWRSSFLSDKGKELFHKLYNV